DGAGGAAGWGVGAAASKAAGGADAVGGVRDNADDKGKSDDEDEGAGKDKDEDKDESSDEGDSKDDDSEDKDESSDEDECEDKEPPKVADPQSADNESYPPFGEPPEGWSTGDPVTVSDIGDVIVDHSDSSGYSVNGKHIDMVSMNSDAKPVNGYTNRVEL